MQESRINSKQMASLFRWTLARGLLNIMDMLSGSLLGDVAMQKSKENDLDDLESTRKSPPSGPREKQQEPITPENSVKKQDPKGPRDTRKKQEPDQQNSPPKRV